MLLKLYMDVQKQVIPKTKLLPFTKAILNCFNLSTNKINNHLGEIIRYLNSILSGLHKIFILKGLIHFDVKPDKFL